VLGLVVVLGVVGLVFDPGMVVVFGAGTGICTEAAGVVVLELPVAGLAGVFDPGMVVVFGAGTGIVTEVGVVPLELPVAGLAVPLEPPVTAVVAAFLAVSIAQAVPTGKV
jgi:hypothetical protein